MNTVEVHKTIIMKITHYKCRHCKFFMQDGKYSFTGTCNNKQQADKKKLIYCNSDICDGFDKEGGKDGQDK